MLGKITRVLILSTVGLAGASASASSDLTFLASSFETLYRITPEDDIESWHFPGTSLRGMHRDIATGEVLVYGDATGSSPYRLYLMENPWSGTPTLTRYADLSRLYGSMTQIGDTVYALSRGDLYHIDLSGPDDVVETYIGDTGIAGSAGAAYDPTTHTFYMASFRSGALYTIDLKTAGATFVGQMGIDAYDLGAEWYDGNLYVAAQNGSSGYLEIGRLDTTSGEYSSVLEVASVAARAASLAVIPEPTMFALLLVGGLGAARFRVR